MLTWKQLPVKVSARQDHNLAQRAGQRNLLIYELSSRRPSLNQAKHSAR